MTLLPRVIIAILLTTLCVACGVSDNDNQIASTQALGVDTSAVAGFWDFSSTDPEFPDEQYVELTTDGTWNIYVRFPNDSNTQNCYDHQVAIFNPIGNDRYKVTSPSGQIQEIGLGIVNNELEYTLTRPGEESVSTFTFPAVQGLIPVDLPVCS